MRVLLSSVTVATLLTVVAAAQGSVEWRNERLTVRAKGAPLKEVVESIANRTGIRVNGVDRLSGLVSVDVRDSALLEGLELVMQGVNHLVTVEGEMVHVWIHSMAGKPVSDQTRSIDIAGLTDHVPGETLDPPPTNDDPDSADPDVGWEEEERAELDQAINSADRTAVFRTINALQSDYPRVRLRAVGALAGRDPKITIPPLTDALSDEEVDVAMAAADLLAAIPDRAALDALISRLSSDAESGAQLAALRGLARRADPASIPSVRRALDQVDPAVRTFAAQLLRELEERERAASAAGPAR